MSALAAPYTQAGTAALPALSRLIGTYLQPRVGKESALLRTQHALSLQGITKGQRSALARSRLYWGGTGNVGRGRGEALRIGQAGTEATNLENLQYGLGQEQFKRQGVTDYLNALMGQAGLGLQGANIAVGGIQTRAAGQQQFWGDIAGIMQGITATLEEQQRARQEQNWMGNLFAGTGNPSPTFDGGGSVSWPGTASGLPWYLDPKWLTNQGKTIPLGQ
jgi:hypothetical protein